MKNINKRFRLEAYLSSDGWDINITDDDGNFIKHLDWQDFGFTNDDIFTRDEMVKMGFEVV